MPEKIAILADSGSDVPAELLNSYDNIEVAPMIVTMDGKEYRDNVDITPEEFYAAWTMLMSCRRQLRPHREVLKPKSISCVNVALITSSASRYRRTFRPRLARLPTLPERRPIFKWTWSTPRTLGLAADCLRCTQKK